MVNADITPALQRYVALVEYAGVQYHGWQKQPQADSVQSRLEKALSKVANQPIQVVCAGRTDAGVHALGQVVHFDAPKGLRSPRNWLLGGNVHLPDDIKLLSVNNVSMDFHARFSATERHYQYWLKAGGVRSGVFHYHCGYCNYSLDIDRMSEAADGWIGRHDFSSFRSSRCQAKSTVRVLTRLNISIQHDMLLFEVSANAFLHHMVRFMIAALVEVGRGRRSVSWAHDLVKFKEGTVAKLVDAKGLYLVGVDYPSLFGIKKRSSTWCCFV
ncbi:MAG TPA: tRNA pseudouridine(38-40) synthase TruA [Gammaproteobacteria bacterium]|nr:tRNA pseudouridine(38-40) synthase TruA [Gammaproteobacteria bacterium]